MALFKILKGGTAKSELPKKKVDGYCYFDYSTGKFYIDYDDGSGVVARMALNAETATNLASSPIVLMGRTEDGVLGVAVKAGEKTSDYAQIPIATTSQSGIISAADKTKLDGIATGANKYSLPLASSSTRGGVKIGYTQSGKNYPVQLDTNEKMYVNVPWTDTTVATNWATARTLSWTGDATGSMNVDGSKNVSAALTLANSGVTAGSYGPSANATLGVSGSFSVPYITVDAKGRITAASTKTITLPADTKVTNTLNTTAQAYITGTTSATTNTGTQVFDTGVYLSTTAGELVATKFTGALNGNAATATKATYLSTVATNPTTTTTDTYGSSGFWAGKNTGVYWYSTAGLLNNQPSQYGLLLDVGTTNNEHHQIWMTQSNGALYHRGMNSQMIGTWKEILDNSNYTNYVPTKTGSGASGTWGISISGNAATATKATQDGNGATISSTYVKIAGSTMTGNLKWSCTGFNTITSPNSNSDVGFKTINSNGVYASLQVGSGGVNHGIYSGSLAKWLIFATASDAYIPQWASAGSSSTPVYFNSSGRPVACTPSDIRTSLGLSNAMHFIGIATVDITDGSTTDPQISGYTFTSDRLYGDVIIDKNSSYEYVWTSAGKWERLGPDGSYKVVQTAVSSPSTSGSTTAFLDTISQDAQGKITVTKKNVLAPQNGAWWNDGFARVQTNGVMEIGRYIDFHGTSATTKDFDIRIDAGTTAAGNTLYLPDVTGQLVVHANNTAVGSGTTPVYIAASGQATASSSTVGSSSLPVYLNAGTITACSTTLGVSVTGNAATATKWATARTLTVGNHSVSLDGTSNQTLQFPLKYATYGSDTANTAGWYKVGTWSLSGYNDHNAILSVISGYGTRGVGLFKFGVRCDNGTTLKLTRFHWLVRTSNFSADSFYWKDNGDNTYSIYVYRPVSQYGRICIDVISEIGTSQKTAMNWTLNSNTIVESSTPTGGTNSTDEGIVNYANSAGSVAWSNVSSKPSSLKNPYALTVQFNGTTNKTYDGSSAQTVNITPSAIGAAASSHTHSYLPLAGGTLSSSGAQIQRAGSSVGWYQGRSNAMVRINSYSGYNSVYSMKTTNGDWSCGVYTNDTLYWTYITDTNYSAASNSVTARMYLDSAGSLTASKVYNAVWNDYAEFRAAETIEPGRTVIEDKSGKMKVSTERLHPGASIISDTFGHAMGETDKCKTPLAVAGRVLTYPYEDRDSYPLGAAVCTGPNGTVSLMTREEIMMYPERIVGTVSEIPNYETWGTGNVKVNGRIWIKVK